MSKISNAAERKQALKELAVPIDKREQGGYDRAMNAGKEALDEQRRETRFSSPELEKERDFYKPKDRYGDTVKMKEGGKVSKCPYDGIAKRGKTRAKFK